MLHRRSILIAALCLAPFVAGCSSDRATGLVISDSIFGDWTVTSFVVFGQNVWQPGWVMSWTLREDGTFSSSASGPGIECETPSCAETGSYSHTSSQITLFPGTPAALVFEYVQEGSTMTWTGTIDGVLSTMVMKRT